MTYTRKPWYWKFSLFTLRRKNRDVLQAMIKTLDSLQLVSKRYDLSSEQISELIDLMIADSIKKLNRL